MAQDFLLEIGTEELPAKSLRTISNALAENIKQELNAAKLKFADLKAFATPRRLAVLITQLQEQQADREVEKRGPALRAAYDADNKPTPALTGFARSCGVDISQLCKLETTQGSWLVYRYHEKGKSVHELMPALIQQAVNALPIAKSMCWGDLDISFSRPVHWVVMMYGDKVINENVLGIAANNITYGHRFLCPNSMTISTANAYEKLLAQSGYVIADFTQRKENIRQQIIKAAQATKGHVIIDEDLLNEVTGIVEWPIALTVEFDQEFLQVPKEALISAMQNHQKSFPVADNNQHLLPVFITISNIQSKNVKDVIQGNARVMRARLSDAKFFYKTDCQLRLDARLDALKNIVFQTKLGSLFDKSQRISKLANFIADKLNSNPIHAERAGSLAKADLISTMVGEFPELQGIMGAYYAEHDQEPREVAIAIREHYLPRFAGDQLPATITGCAIALADRLDTLIGIFGINQAPTGDKDPFALRRAALGILRILVEKQLNLNLLELLQHAQNNYTIDLPNINLVQQAFDFIYERFRAWYQEQHIAADVFAAVYAKRPAAPYDFELRIKAVNEFKKLPPATALIAANKRVSNILIKENQQDLAGDINTSLLQADEEKNLARAVAEKTKQVVPLYEAANYTAALTELASLQAVVDSFFDKVMVMVDDKNIRHNRLVLLTKLRNLFLEIADISLLQ